MRATEGRAPFVEAAGGRLPLSLCSYVAMSERGKSIDVSWEMLEWMQKGSDYKWQVLKFIKKGIDLIGRY